MMNKLWFFLVLVLVLISGSCSTDSKVSDESSRPPHHTDGGYKNLYIKDPEKNFFDFLRMRYFGDTKWSEHERFADQIPWQELDLEKIEQPGEAPQISWLGHSTFLIQYRGVNLLTDPIFCERTSPISFMGPKRYTNHVVDYTKLPPVDYVIISHNHYDHLDIEALNVLHSQKRTPRYYVPLGIKSWIVDSDPRIKNENVVEMDWGEHDHRDEIKVSAYPSQHWSARGLFDRFETLWASWRITMFDFHFWFVGDTGYNERLFRELGEAMPPVDLSLIPIGAYAPRHFMRFYHLNPEEAVLVHQHIKTKRSIGMHWGTFPLTAEDPTEPPIRLQQAVSKAGLKGNEFGVMALGETLVIDLSK